MEVHSLLLINETINDSKPIDKGKWRGGAGEARAQWVHPSSPPFPSSQAPTTSIINKSYIQLLYVLYMLVHIFHICVSVWGFCVWCSRFPPNYHPTGGLIVICNYTNKARLCKERKSLPACVNLLETVHRVVMIPNNMATNRYESQLHPPQTHPLHLIFLFL